MKSLFTTLLFASVLFIGLITFWGYKYYQITTISAQTTALANPPEAIGPELAYFDEGNQRNVYEKILVPQSFTGAVQVINEIDGKPHNPAPGTSATLRLAGITPSTTEAAMANFAKALNASSDFPAGTIVIVGNEMNNLDKEFKVPEATFNNPTDLADAARLYGRLYLAFARAIDHSKFRVAPAPPDLYNSNWNPIPWVQAFSTYLNANNGCSVTDALIANVFDVAPRVNFPPLESYKYLEENICGLKVTRFGGWGAWPQASIAEQVEFYNTTTLPAGITEATTLIADNCDGRQGFATDSWLFYVKGKVYRLDGTELDPATCSTVATTRPYTLKEVACSDTQDPEYHSLRPYPASPTCGENVPDGVWLCGNDLILRHTYNVSRENGQDCRLVGEGKERCTYNVSGSSKIYLDLAEADFPIMGNTENIPNAVSSATGLSDGQRVNEYVSWYLNGVINRAEEFPLNMSNPLDVRRLIDFSGPLKKLLPKSVQDNLRLEEVSQSGTTGEEGRHNQIVECGGDSPFPCYDNPDNPPSRVRIEDQKPPAAIPYTPFSSTEDSTGLIKVGTSTSQVSGDDLTVSNVTYSPLTHASGEASSQKKLYFAHLFESNELSETLQLTYKPQGYTGLEGSWSDSQNPTYCELLESRDNEGDNLYGELEIERGGVTQKEPRLEGTASYSATFSCTLDLVRPCRNEYDPVAGNIVEVCDPTPTCEVHVPVAFSVEVYTPKENDNIWNRLVGAHMSVVKRIFPQIGSSSPIDELKDIPGKTTVTYGVDGQSGGAASVSTLAGDPSRSRPGSQAQLFFPHLGSVQEYFLHGIQEALRPQGFASVAPISSTPINTSELCAPENFSDFGASADKVSCVCEKESIGGNPNALNTGCLKTGAASTWDYSVGLFQINLLVHPNVAPPDLIQRFRDAGYSNAEALNCPMAFSSIGETYKDGKIYRMKEACVIQDKKLLDICVDYYSQPVNNVRYAIDLAKRGGWGHWNLSAQACGLL